MLLRCAPRVDDASEDYDLCGATSRSRSRWPFCVAHTTQHNGALTWTEAYKLACLGSTTLKCPMCLTSPSQHHRQRLNTWHLQLLILVDERAPVIEYVAPAPADIHRDASPVIKFVAPAPVVTSATSMAVIQVVAQAPGVIFSAPSPVTDHLAPATAITFTTQAPVIEYVESTPSDFCAAPARVIDHVAPAPVIEHNAPPLAVTCFAPCEQLPLDTMVTVTIDVSSGTTCFVNPQFF